MENSNHTKTTKVDIQWIFTLFGTAIGAGLLYLPVQAGHSGLWALVTVLIFALPLTYYSHKNMANIVLYTDNGGITDVFGCAAWCGRSVGSVQSPREPPSALARFQNVP